MIEISLYGTEAVDGHRTHDRPSLVQSDPALHQPAGAGPADRDGGEDPVHLGGGPGPRGRAEGLPRRQRRLHAHGPGSVSHHCTHIYSYTLYIVLHGPGSVSHHCTLWNCTHIYSYTIYIVLHGPGSVSYHCTLWNCTHIYSYTICILIYIIYILTTRPLGQHTVLY